MGSTLISTLELGEPIKREMAGGRQHTYLIKLNAEGPEHLSVANLLLYLASPYRTRGEYVKAEPMFERALRIYQKALGQEHPTTAERGRS